MSFTHIQKSPTRNELNHHVKKIISESILRHQTDSTLFRPYELGFFMENQICKEFLFRF